MGLGLGLYVLENRKISASAGNLTSNSRIPVCSLITIPTEPSWLVTVAADNVV